MELNSLPDDCLLLLLELFPVNVQAQLRAVCTQWKWLVERAWLKVNKIDIKYYNRNICIAFDNHEVSFKVASGLKRLVTREHFPGVTVLCFEDHLLPSNHQSIKDHRAFLLNCLGQWTVTLTDLTLKPFEIARKSQSSVWTRIDSIKSLKSLELRFPNFDSGGGKKWKVPENLSILTNLEKFELDDCWNEGVYALTQLGPNLRYLNLQVDHSEGNFMSILPKLISLTELLINISIFSQPLDLFTSLAQLGQLNKLNLGIFEWNQFTSLNKRNLKYPKLTSVKQLSMRIGFVATPTRRTPQVCIQILNDFNRHFFATIAIMFHALEMIDLKLALYDLYDQEYVDNFSAKMKTKFVELQETKFLLGRGPDGF